MWPNIWSMPGVSPLLLLASFIQHTFWLGFIHTVAFIPSSAFYAENFPFYSHSLFIHYLVDG